MTKKDKRHPLKPSAEKIATVLLSGGIDSAACTHLLASQGFSVSGLFIDYGQAARRLEEASAEKIADYYKLDLTKCRLTSNVNFKSGEIIGRNAFLIFSALMFSDITKGIIALGIHAGTRYYDCSPEFYEIANSIVENYTSNEVKLFAPFLSWTKGDILSYCKRNKMPFDLTYSCENGSNPPCGVCDSCKDRAHIYAK